MAFALALVAGAAADVFSSQLPPNYGGTLRWSKLWIDPNGGNDLDGDAICYEDFVLRSRSKITQIEWWGDSNPNKGFQIEFWRQDPNTIAYQPLGVFRGQGALPEADFVVQDYTFTYDSFSHTYHYFLTLPTPVELAANAGNNPRWFLAVIGRTDVPYLEWNWAQGLGGSNRTFQFIRGGNEGGGDLYRVVGEGRAMIVREARSGRAEARVPRASVSAGAA